jgi:hypothetical protein
MQMIREYHQTKGNKGGTLLLLTPHHLKVIDMPHQKVELAIGKNNRKKIRPTG